MQEEGQTNRKNWRQILYGSFESEEIMKEFYKNRVPWMIRIYMLLFFGRIGSIMHII